MSSKRIVDLAAARSLLFDVSEGLVTAGCLLKSSGLTDDGRAVSRMSAEIEALLKRVRAAQNAAIVAERGCKPSGEVR